MTDTVTSDVTIFELGTVGVLNTRQGLNVLSNGLAGKEIKITRVAIGDGVLEASSEEEYRRKVLNLREMVHWRDDIPIVSCKNLGDGRMELHVRKPNADIPEGYFARERAVFALDQDSGQEILYAYICTGDTSSYIPGNLGAVSRIIDFSIVTIIQNAPNVQVELDASFAYVSMAEYTDHAESEHPHPNIPNHYLNVTSTDRFWAVDVDNDLHQISAANAREVLLGDAAKLYPSIGKTITDNKAKIDELDIFTKASNELGLNANLMIVEDFNPATTVDNFKMKVLSCAAGGKLIGVENDEGIVKGAWYWISDGVNQEMVQAAGIAYSTDYYRVTLTEPLTYSYNLDTVYLYRSTLTGGIGIVDAKSLNYSPPKKFTGIEANISRCLVFNTSMSNAAAMQIEGEGLVTTDGYFVLVNDYGTLIYNPSDETSSGGSSSGGSGSGSCDCDCDCGKKYTEGYISDTDMDKIFGG